MWLAGYLEGEGCFHVDPLGYARVSVEAADYDVVCRAARLMDARPPHFRAGRKKNWSDQWCAAVTGVRAAEVMRAIRPFMGERRGAKIDEVMVEAKTVTRILSRNKKPGIAVEQLFETAA